MSSLPAQLAATPAARPPAAPSLRHRVRLLRARALRGVVVEGTPLLGRGVVLDGSGGRIVLRDGCVVGDGTRLHSRGGTIDVGAGAVLGDGCVLIAHAGIRVAAAAMLGDRAALIDFEPRTADAERPVRLQGLLHAPIAVGKGARVGHGAVVTRGVTLGAGAAIAAHAVVARDAAPGERVEAPPPAPRPRRPQPA